MLTNSWNLAQVRGVLGLFPYSKASFMRLILPTLVTTVVVLFCRMMFRNVAPAGWASVHRMFVAYAVFLGISLFLPVWARTIVLIGRAVWSKMKGILPVTNVGEE